MSTQASESSPLKESNSVRLDFGDKVWVRMGGMFLVGWVVDHSPSFKYFAVSQVPYDEYLKLKKQVPVSWVYTGSVSLDDILKKEDQKDSDSGAGFAFNPSK